MDEASRIAGLPEIVQKGHNGLLCAPADWPAFGDALQRLIEDEPLRWRMGEAGRAHIQSNYDPDVQFNGLLNRLKELADTSARR